MAELDQLVAFTTAAQSGSFSAAARKLGKAQSAISSAIANLEIDLDLNLFDRSGYRPELTEAGVSVLRYAKSVLDSMEALQGQAEALSRDVEPDLCIYLEDGLLVSRVCELLADLATAFPSLALTVEQRERRLVLRAIEQGEADIALVTGPERLVGGHWKRGIGFQRLVPVCHKEFPLAAEREINRDELRRFRQIVGPADDLAAAAHRSLSPTFWASESLDARLALVRAGLGWSELPVDLVTRDVLDGDLRVMEYAFEQNAILDTVGVATPSTMADGPVMRWLRSAFTSWDQRAWIGDHRVGRRRFKSAEG